MKTPGLSWPIEEETADKAKIITRQLIAALDMPFSKELWARAEPEKLTVEYIQLWRRMENEGQKGEALEEFGLGDYIAKQLDDSPTTNCDRILRAALRSLLAAEEIDMPFTYVMTILACYPALKGLQDFYTVTAFKWHTDEEVKGTWAKAYYDAVNHAEYFFHRLLGLRLEGEVVKDE